MIEAADWHRTTADHQVLGLTTLVRQKAHRNIVLHRARLGQVMARDLVGLSLRSRREKSSMIFLIEALVGNPPSHPRDRTGISSRGQSAPT
jgi:hypothetical protein